MFLVFLQRPCLCLRNIAAATALCQMAAAERPLTGNLELQVTVLFPDGKTRPGVDAAAWLPCLRRAELPASGPPPRWCSETRNLS
ncbi:MAG: hypothetical protein RMI39_06390, partial [Thermoanaerobaculum sp.]|nr:hypothetical protein [Thermoanaerobaculum sp.]